MHDSLIAAVEHGPGMHGPVLIALFLIAVVGGVVYGLRQMVQGRRARRTPPDPPRKLDRGPET